MFCGGRAGYCGLTGTIYLKEVHFDVIFLVEGWIFRCNLSLNVCAVQIEELREERSLRNDKTSPIKSSSPIFPSDATDCDRETTQWCGHTDVTPLFYCLAPVNHSFYI